MVYPSPDDGRARMTSNWKTLREPAPASLTRARHVAHYAAQWVTLAARANLPAVPDDSHSALTWDARPGVLTSPALPGGTTVGLRLESLELLVTRESGADRLALHGVAASAVDDWLAGQLTARGLRPHSEAKLPYAVPA